MLHREQVEAGARGVDVRPAVRWLSKCGSLSGKPVVLFEFTYPYDECTLALKVYDECALALKVCTLALKVTCLCVYPFLCLCVCA
jgi:hypothetical protein